MKNFIISLLTVLLVFATSCNEMDQYDPELGTGVW